MSTKNVHISANKQPEVKKLVSIMTIMAWVTLIIGVVLSLVNITHFSDQNLTLMIGIGFLIASVHIYIIGTAIGLVNTRSKYMDKDYSE